MQTHPWIFAITGSLDKQMSLSGEVQYQLRIVLVPWIRLFEHLAYLQSMTRAYCGELWLFPGAGPAGRSMHPLMAWWTVLFALSMLARYQPAEWAAHVDVDSSPHAVPVERLLAQAISHIPELVTEAIGQVAKNVSG